MNPRMESISSPLRSENETEIAEEADEVDPLLTFHHVRTASVILESGARVRRKVSLVSIDEGDSLESGEQSPLLDPGGTVGTSYSSIAPAIIDRSLRPWRTKQINKFVIWLQSEGLKR